MTVEERIALKHGNYVANADLTIARLETQLEEERAKVAALEEKLAEQRTTHAARVRHE